MFPAKGETSRHSGLPGPALGLLKALQSSLSFGQIGNRKQRDEKGALLTPALSIPERSRAPAAFDVALWSHSSLKAPDTGPPSSPGCLELSKSSLADNSPIQHAGAADATLWP